jgi:hypothetical protein
VVPSEDPIKTALKQADQAANECRDKRLRGELPSHVASTDCSNPRIVEAFNNAHYRYMDLIFVYVARRREVGGRIDRKELTDDQGNVEIARAFSELVEAERRRDAGK